MAIRDPDREQKIRATRLRGGLLSEYDQNYLIRCLDCLDETRASLRRVRDSLATFLRETDDPEALAAINEAEHLL